MVLIIAAPIVGDNTTEIESLEHAQSLPPNMKSNTVALVLRYVPGTLKSFGQYFLSQRIFLLTYPNRILSELRVGCKNHIP